MKCKILVAAIFTMCFLASVPVYAASTSYPEFTDTSGVSDADFFGVWDTSSQSWKVAPQLNYDGFSALTPVSDAVKNGDYTLAKEELLQYYRNRTGITYPDKPNTAANADPIFWGMHDSLAYKDTYLTDIDITSSAFTEYSIDLGQTTNSGSFYLSSVQKSEDMIEIYSRESEYAPRLVITKTNGEVISLEPIKDTYIRAGQYAQANYGEDTYLYVKDDYTLSDGKYLPYGDNTRRSYVFFDKNQIPSKKDISSVELKITARLKPEGNKLSDSCINLIVLNPYNKAWSETDDGSSLKPMTWSNYEIGHFSWQGLPGGIVWEKPENSQNEFLNSNTRFTQIAALVRKSQISETAAEKEAYLYKSMELVLDFIGETTDQISTGVPNKRDIESANRCLEFSAIYKFYLDSEFMNPDAHTAMLKWLFQETSYLYNGAAVLYNGPTDDIRENGFAYTNRGAWHCAGFLASLAYFPEFAGSDDWEAVLNKRLQKNVDYIIADDGCYREATIGYAENVIKHYRTMITTWKNTNKEPLANLDKKMQNLGRYLMYVGYPDGNAPKWGDNSGSSRTMVSKLVDYVDDPELLYYASEGKEGTVPASNSIQFDSLRIVTSRTGWEADDSMLFINALTAGNHRHRDALALTLYHDGKEILEDTGNTAYDADHPHFKWQRETSRSHNTIEIDETPQVTTNKIEEGVPGYIDLNANENADMITAWTDGTPGFRHNRNLLWIKGLDLLVVNDMVESSDDLVHKYTQNWHTYSGYSSNPTIDTATFTGSTNYDSGTQLLIAQADTTDMKLELLEGYSCISAEPTQYFSYEKNVKGNASFSTALLPVSEGDTAAVEAAKLSVTGAGDAQAMNISLDQNGVLQNIVTFTSFEEDNTLHTFDGYATDADGAYWILDADGNLTGGGMYGGSFIKLGDQTILQTNREVENVTFTVYDGIVDFQCPDDCTWKDFVLGDSLKGLTPVVNGQIPHTAHSYDQKVEVDAYLKSSADCGSGALYYYSCECGKAGTETFEVGDAVGEHTYGEWTTVKEATTTETGLKQKECSVCHDIQEEVIPVLAPPSDDDSDDSDDKNDGQGDVKTEETKPSEATAASDDDSNDSDDKNDGQDDVKTEEVQPSEATAANVAATGDNARLGLWMLLMGVTGLGLAMLLLIKRKYR